MTNAVDILLVDGPAHGRVVCMKKPLTATLTVQVDGVGDVQYVRRQHVYYGSNKQYHVALPPDSEVSDDFIDGTIFVLNFQPAWDLPTVEQAGV